MTNERPYTVSVKLRKQFSWTIRAESVQEAVLFLHNNYVLEEGEEIVEVTATEEK